VVKTILLIPTLLCCPFLFSQDTLAVNIKALPTSITSTYPSPKKERIYLAAGATVVGFTAGMTILANAWYKDYPRVPFHFFNDINDWLQVDKAGHVFSSYTAGKWSMELWRWAGLPRKQRIWIGGLSGAAFATMIEILDGQSQGWGFSPGDLVADFAGAGIFIAQELAWDEQRIQLKFSFHQNNYEDPELNQRAKTIFGSSITESMLKDYNSQTYWASVNLKSFFKKSRLPAWLNIALGYGANGMLGGTENIARDKDGVIIFNRTDVARYRQWYLAPDIDLTKIKTKSKFLKTTFFLLNSLKFPTPSIGFSKKGVEWNWMHF
jgi:uncharacterized protein YfiM (DUF2279 family)